MAPEREIEPVKGVLITKSRVEQGNGVFSNSVEGQFRGDVEDCCPLVDVEFLQIVGERPGLSQYRRECQRPSRMHSNRKGVTYEA